MNWSTMHFIYSDDNSPIYSPFVILLYFGRSTVWISLKCGTHCFPENAEKFNNLYIGKVKSWGSSCLQPEVPISFPLVTRSDSLIYYVAVVGCSSLLNSESVLPSQQKLKRYVARSWCYLIKYTVFIRGMDTQPLGTRKYDQKIKTHRLTCMFLECSLLKICWFDMLY